MSERAKRVREHAFGDEARLEHGVCGCRRGGVVTLRTGRIALFKMRNCSRFASLISPNWMVSAGFFGSRAFSSPDILRLGMVG